MLNFCFLFEYEAYQGLVCFILLCLTFHGFVSTAELGIVSTLDPFKFGDAELLQNALRPLGFAFRVQKFSVPMTFPDVATTTAAALGHPLRAALAEVRRTPKIGPLWGVGFSKQCGASALRAQVSLGS